MPALYSNQGYPSQTGNRITVGVAADEAVFARRHFEGVTSGQIYMAGLMAYRYVGDYKSAGLSFYNGSSELAFVGKAGNAQVLAIDSYGDTKMESGHAMVGTEAWAGGSTGNVYLVIARYDFGSKQIQARVYNRNVAVPALEPGSWEVSATAPGGGFGRVD